MGTGVQHNGIPAFTKARGRAGDGMFFCQTALHFRRGRLGRNKPVKITPPWVRLMTPSRPAIRSRRIVAGEASVIATSWSTVTRLVPFEVIHYLLLTGYIPSYYSRVICIAN